MAPRCFISFARRNRDPYLERFFEDLREEIVLREDVEPDEAVFLYTEEPTGADWKGALGRALIASAACVTIYSPSYFRREYCGKEFQVFLDRANVEYDDDGAATNARGIFPILWSREKDLRKKKLPPRIAKRINYNGKDLHERYVRDGLRHILRQDPKGDYVKLLQTLANDLVDEVFPKAPRPLDEPPAFNAIRNPFDEEPSDSLAAEAPTAGPLHLPFVLLTDRESEGAFSLSKLQPWLEDLEEEEFTLQLDAAYPADEPPLRIVEMLRKAGSSNAQAIVILDPWLTTDPLREYLLRLLDEESWQGALLIPVAEDARDSAVDATLGASFTAPDAVVVKAVTSELGRFAVELRSVVLELAKRLVEEGERHRSLPEGGQPGQRPQISGPRKRDNGD